MTGSDPIVFVCPTLLEVAVTAAIAGALPAAALLLLGWVFLLGAPTPANPSGPWWSWANLRDVAKHTADKVRRMREAARPQPLPDDPTVHLDPLNLIPREGDDHDRH